MVEARAQCGAERAEFLFFAWAQIFHSTAPSLPSRDSCLFCCCLDSPFCRTCRPSWAYTRQDCSTLTFFRREERHQGFGALRLCTWSQLSSEQGNGGRRGDRMVRRKTQRDQAVWTVDPQNWAKIFSPGGIGVLLTLVFITWVFLFSVFSELNFSNFMFHGYSSGIKQNTDWSIILLHFSASILLFYLSFPQSFRLWTSAVIMYQTYAFIVTVCSCTHSWVLKPLRYWVSSLLNFLLSLAPILGLLPLSLSSCRVWITSHIQRAQPIPGIAGLWRKRTDQSGIPIQISLLLLLWWPPQNTRTPAVMPCPEDMIVGVWGHLEIVYWKV